MKTVKRDKFNWLFFNALLEETKKDKSLKVDLESCASSCLEDYINFEDIGDEISWQIIEILLSKPQTKEYIMYNLTDCIGDVFDDKFLQQIEQKNNLYYCDGCYHNFVLTDREASKLNELDKENFSCPQCAKKAHKIKSEITRKEIASAKSVLQKAGYTVTK